MDMMMDEERSKAPTKAPDERIQGTLYKWKDSDYLQFAPREKKDQPTREVLASSKNGSYYHTLGEKQSRHGIMLSVPSTTVDPAGELLRLAHETLDAHARKPVKNPNPRQLVVDSGHLKIYRSKKEKKLQIIIEADTRPADSVVLSAISECFREIYKLLPTLKRI